MIMIARHLGTPNSDFNGCHCMRDPVLYRSMSMTVQVVCVMMMLNASPPQKKSALGSAMKTSLLELFRNST